MKLGNFASLDPAQGGKGLQNASAQDRKTWDEFHHDWEALALECEQLRARLLQQRPGLPDPLRIAEDPRSEEHTSELQSLMRISYAVFCLKKKNTKTRWYINRTIYITTTNTCS